jgi:hypothetical protein
VQHLPITTLVIITACDKHSVAVMGQLDWGGGCSLMKPLEVRVRISKNQG